MKKLLALLFPRPRKLLLIHRYSSRVRLSEWRQSKDLVESAKKFLNNPDFLILLDCVKNESPANWIITAHTGIEDRAIIQARIEGYTLAIANLEALGTWQKPTEELEATFEQPEEVAEEA